ncbi:hypothetical protein [Brevundimonas bullata]|uniref:hypothetical protein n=1 Tax=Brevundimonas bullata TaxID=13160 RepID=UPI002FD8B08B
MNWRILSPKGWAMLIGAMALVAALILLANAWNGLWSFLPWSAESRLERAETARDVAQDDASARSLESQGQADQIQRIETVHRQIVTVQTATQDAITQARSAPDANDPLEPGRAVRLQSSDRMLCGYAPDLCRPAAPDAAGAR